MELNDNKAGMEGLEKCKINAIIKEASKNSRYFKHGKQRENRIREKIEQQRKVLATFTAEKIRLAEMHMDRLAEKLESERDLSRTVVHIDMDAFYAQVEMRDDPSLRNKPIAVGSTSMLSTSNYAARKFGVRAAQPGFIGKKLCPDLIIVPCNFKKYTKCSETIREQMKIYDPNYAPMSLDEAYLDLTDFLLERRRKQGYFSTEKSKRIRYSGDCRCRLPYDESLLSKSLINTCDLSESLTVPVESAPSNNGGLNSCDKNQADNAAGDSKFDEIYEETCSKCSKKRTIFVDTVEFGNDAQDVVKELRFKIEQATGLTASAGISVNAMLAKVCSDKNKPNGQYYLPPDKNAIMDFVNCLPIRKVSGIGGVTESMLKALGVSTCGDIYEKRAIISLLFSKISTKFFIKVSLGLGSSMFEHRDSDRKSISVERTFSEINLPSELHDVCFKLCEKLSDCLEDEEVKGRTVTLKMKTVDFDVKTRAQSSSRPISNAQELYDISKGILQEEINLCAPGKLRLRLMGVRLSNLTKSNQLDRQRKSDASKEITDFFKPVSAVNKNGTCESNISAAATVGHNCKTMDPDNRSFDVILLSDDDDSDVDKANTSLTDESRDSCSSAQPINNDVVTCESKGFMIPKLPICPVCNFKQRNITDLNVFNAHVDNCLSLKTIGEMNEVERISVIEENVHKTNTAASSCSKKEDSVLTKGKKRKIKTKSSRFARCSK